MLSESEYKSWYVNEFTNKKHFLKFNILNRLLLIQIKNFPVNVLSLLCLLFKYKQKPDHWKNPRLISCMNGHRFFNIIWNLAWNMNFLNSSFDIIILCSSIYILKFLFVFIRIINSLIFSFPWNYCKIMLIVLRTVIINIMKIIKRLSHYFTIRCTKRILIIILLVFFCNKFHDSSEFFPSILVVLSFDSNLMMTWVIFRRK